MLIAVPLFIKTKYDQPFSMDRICFNYSQLRDFPHYIINNARIH